MNEFGALTPDELHFLRVFIYCEGRIRDMEAALGVSYPTVKGQLASIKEKLNLARLRPSAPGAPAAGTSQLPEASPASAGPGEPEPSAAGGMTAEEILDGLEAGRISYKDALIMLRGKKEGGAGR